MLLTELTWVSGLQDKVSQVASSNAADPGTHYIPGRFEADCTLAVIGLLSQCPPWRVSRYQSSKSIPGERDIFFQDRW